MSKIAGEMAQMDALSRDFNQASTQVQQLMSSLDGITNNTIGTGWEGASARKFMELWNGEFKSSLTKLNGALGEAGGEVTRRKNALIQADS